MDIPVDGIAKAIIESARQPFLVLNQNRQVVAANPAFCKAFGCIAEEILGKPLEELCQCSWDIPSLRQALEGLPGEPSFDDVEIEKDFPGLGLRTMRMNARMVAPDLGPGAHTVLSIEDITERKTAQARLLESEERFRRLFETAQDGILILDAGTGRIEQANPYLARILEADPADLQGKEIWELGFFEDAEASREAFRRLQQDGYIRFEDLPLETRRGHKVEVEFVCNVYPVGSRNMIQCNIRDVGDRKRAERGRQAAEGLLRRSLKDEAVVKLAGGVAHEYNNLLQSITGFASLSLSHLDSGHPLYPFLAEILRAGDRAAELTRQLLAYSGQQVMAPALVDPNALVASVRRLLAPLVGEEIQVEQDLEGGIGLVKADPGQMERALLNLAVNARDAMPRGGRLTFRTRRAAGPETGGEAAAGGTPSVVLSVTDTGKGMEESVRSRVFDPFFTTHGMPGSAGLGLSMVQGIVAQSGGRVIAESEPGRGSTFKVVLPIAGEAPRSAAEPERAGGEMAPAIHEGGSGA